MIKGHRIEKFEEVKNFLNRIEAYDETRMESTKHTLFRLSERQRKVFSCENLKRILLHENPLKVGIQYNGNYALYYSGKESSEVIKMIIDLKPSLIKVVTFYVIDNSQLPKR